LAGSLLAGGVGPGWAPAARAAAADPAAAGPRLAAEAGRIVGRQRAVFTAPPGRVPSRDSAGGPLLGNGDLGAVLSGAPEAQKFWLSKNNFWRLKDGHRQGGPRLFGGLEINIPALSNGTYRVEQQLFPAITVGRFGRGASTVTMRSLVAATAPVLLVELAVEGDPVAVETRLWAAPGRGSAEELGRQGDVLWATKAFTTNVNIPTAAACALAVLGGRPVHPPLEPWVEEVRPNPPPKRPPPPKSKSQPGPKFTLQPGQPVTVAVALQSSCDGPDPRAAAQALARGLTTEQVRGLREQHARWWREFWAQALVEIGDPVLEQRYYLSNYLMGSGSRDREFPQGLFGLWVTDDDPRWAGDYHLNYNYQASFYGLYSGNHLEQAATYHAPILAFMERGRWYATNLLHVRGVYYSVGIGPKGIETCRKDNLTDKNYQAGGFFSGQKCNAAYAVVPMSMHWYHSYDPDYARTVYPFVKEVATFWEDYLKFEPFDVASAVAQSAMADKQGGSGRYVIYNDCIVESMDTAGNEGDKDFNSIMSLGLVRNALETALDMGQALGLDADRRPKWQDILKHLSKFPTFEKDGKTVFRYTEKGIDWWASNSCGIQHIYPAGALGLDSDPHLLEIARNTITAHSRWIDHNGMNSFYPAAVRVGYDPAIILKELRAMVEKIGQANGLTAGVFEGVENCSIVPATINEMLCMSHPRVLRLFPVWPRDRDARFWNLRAEGAFLVSSALQGGAVPFVKLYSERGRDCTLVNPWPGRAVDVYRDGRKAATLPGARIVLPTAAGATLVLCPAGAPYRAE